MDVRADSDNRFLQRFLLVAIVCYGFGLWSLYDGLVSYPRELERARSFEQIMASTEDDLQQQAQWESVAKERGWKLAPPKKSVAELESDIQWQYGMAIVAAIVGTILLVNYLRTRNSWVELNGEKIQTSWGQTIHISSIQELDKRRWQKKGIARIQYLDDDGRVRRFVLDDFKYDQQAMDGIIRKIESVIDRDRIVGGPTQEELGDGSPRSAGDSASAAPAPTSDSAGSASSS